MSAIARGLAISVLATVSMVSQSNAQKPNGPGPRPGWLARVANTSLPNVSAPDVRIAMTRLEQIEKLLLQVPEIAQPRGFEIFPKYSIGERILHPDETQRKSDVVAYSILLMFAAPTWEIAGEGSPCIAVRVNQPLTGEASLWEDEQGRRIYTDLQRGRPMPLATQVWGSFAESPLDPNPLTVLFTSGGELPYRNITRDEYYNSIIYWDETGLGMNRADYRQRLQTTPYQEWLAGAAKRKQEREELFKTLAGTVPAAELAQMRKLAEENEREVGESLKKSEADDRVAGQRASSRSSMMSDSVRAERSRQTPAELRLPALFGGDDDRLSASGRSLVDRDGPGIQRILTPNYDFWRARRSPVEVRSIEVRLQAHLTCSRPDVKRALWAAYQKLDWAAFNRMLDVPVSR